MPKTKNKKHIYNQWVMLIKINLNGLKQAKG